MNSIHLLMELVLSLIVVDLGVVEALENVALNKNTYQPDSYGYGSDKAVDGDTSHDLCSHTHEYWEVDLGFTCSISHVKIYNTMSSNSHERLKDVELNIGLKRTSYTQYGFHEGVVGSDYTFQMSKTVFGRWVRITRRPSADEYLTLCEVQVFAKQYYGISRNNIGTDIQKSMTSRSDIHCAYICHKTNGCKAANYDESKKTCDLLGSVAASTTEDVNDVMLIPR